MIIAATLDASPRRAPSWLARGLIGALAGASGFACSHHEHRLATHSDAGAGGALAPDDHGRAMPPHGTRQLDAGGTERLIEYLRRNQRTPEDDALLESAAALGMAVDPYDQLGL